MKKPKKPKKSRLCERCVSTGAKEPKYRVIGERFCKKCRSALLKEMKASGYLQDLPKDFEHYQSIDSDDLWHNDHE